MCVRLFMITSNSSEAVQVAELFCELMFKYIIKLSMRNVQVNLLLFFECSKMSFLQERYKNSMRDSLLLPMDLNFFHCFRLLIFIENLY